MPARTVTTIATTDRDTIATVKAFKKPRKYPTFTEALDKLVNRAARINLHRMNDQEFEYVVDIIARRLAEPASPN